VLNFNICFLYIHVTRNGEYTPRGLFKVRPDFECNKAAALTHKNSQFRYPPYSSLATSSPKKLQNMSGGETLQKQHADSDSDTEEEDVVETIQKVEIDPSKLTPLSPEVISKQVNIARIFVEDIPDQFSTGYHQFRCAQRPLTDHAMNLIDFALSRYHWSCRSRKIHSGEGNIWCDDSPV